LKRRSGKSCLLFIIFLLLVASTLWLFYKLGPFQLSKNVSPEIETITGNKGMLLERTQSYETSFGRISQYQAEINGRQKVIFDVDGEKNVVGYFRTEQSASSVTINKDQALSIARQFALLHYPDPDLVKTTPETAELVSSIEDLFYYKISWTKVDPSTGAYLPQNLQVLVNAQAGDIIGYQRLYQEGINVGQVNIIEADAIEIALSTIQQFFDQPAVSDSELLVTVIPIGDRNGEMKTIWKVHVYGKVDDIGSFPEADLLIDASSGKVLQILPMQ
jgi:hypothetical protein